MVVSNFRTYFIMPLAASINRERVLQHIGFVFPFRDALPVLVPSETSSSGKDRGATILRQASPGRRR